MSATHSSLLCVSVCLQDLLDFLLVLGALHSHCEDFVALFLFSFQAPQWYPLTWKGMPSFTFAKLMWYGPSALLPSFSSSRILVKTLLECLYFPYYSSFLHIFHFSYCSVGISSFVEFSVSLILPLTMSTLRFMQFVGLSPYLQAGVLFLESPSVILMEEVSFYLLELLQSIPFSFSLYHDLSLCVFEDYPHASSLLFTLSFSSSGKFFHFFLHLLFFPRHHFSSQPLNVILHVCLAVSLSPLWWTGLWSTLLSILFFWG